MPTRFDLSKFTKQSRKALERAQNLAATLKHQHVDSEHTLVSMLEQDDSPVAALLNDIGADAKRVGRRLVERCLDSLLSSINSIHYRTPRVFAEDEQEANKHDQSPDTQPSIDVIEAATSFTFTLGEQ